MSSRPAATEYDPFYSDYVALVTEQDVLLALQSQGDDVRRLAAAVEPARESFRYAPGKWSVREVLGHVADAERVFGYRAFCISRGERAHLPGFDENDYVAASGFERRPLAELAEDWWSVREANLHVLRALDEAAWSRSGVANENGISVRALAYVLVGHARHHLRVLRERYAVAER
jgi:DinB superfamily